MKENDILESWKEISAYLKRSVKTCRRLAKELGLPVHRLEDSPKARVFAYKEEIDRWRAESQHSEKKLLAEPEEGEPGIPIMSPALTEKKPFTSKEVREATVKFGLKTLLVTASVVILFVLGAVLIRSILPRKKSPLVQKIENSIAVVSFENQSGDKAYDYLQRAIPNLLITSLEQSGYFSVATWERLYDLLKQKGKGDVELIDRDLGFDLCQMDGIDAIVLGSFTKAADMFATDVKVLDVDTKKMLKSASSRGEGVDSILRTQIDELTKEICLGMGRSEKKREATQAKVAEVTTNSVEAYDLFIRGREEWDKFYWDEAIRFLKKSVELDPTFAASYLYLSQAYTGQRNVKARDEAIEKAKIFSAKTNERERLYIDAFYARYIEEDPDKYVQKLSEIVKKFPKDKQAYITQTREIRAKASNSSMRH
jgi:TolB-like protein